MFTMVPFQVHDGKRYFLLCELHFGQASRPLENPSVPFVEFSGPSVSPSSPSAGSQNMPPASE